MMNSITPLPKKAGVNNGDCVWIAGQWNLCAEELPSPPINPTIMKRKIVIVSLLVLFLGFIWPLAGRLLAIKHGIFPAACREEIGKNTPSFVKIITLYLDLDYPSVHQIRATWRTIFYFPIYRESINISDTENCG